MQDLRQIIPVEQKDGINTVNARKLYKFLGVNTKFADWIKRNIEDFDFNAGVDFMAVSQKRESGGITKEYYLSIDMAKELAMLSRSAKGKDARKYFIEIEKSYKQGVKKLSNTELILELAKVNHEQEQRLQAVEQQIENIKNNNKKMIQDTIKNTLKKEQIGIFPTGCLDLKGIRKNYFKGISESNISVYLQHKSHPRKEYKSLIKGNEVRSSLVYEEKGLSEQYRNLIKESAYIKETDKNYIYTHSVIGVYRIKK